MKGKIERVVFWIVIVLMVAGNANNARNISVKLHNIDVKLDRLIKSQVDAGYALAEK